MKKYKEKWLAGLLAAGLLLAGCATQTQTPQNATAPQNASEAAVQTTVTDMTGREVALPEKVERIAVLSAADCEILYAIGAGDLVVGRGTYCDYPKECLEIPAVDTGADTNLEEVLALDPQVVILSTMNQTIEQVETLEKAGVAVLVTKAEDLEGVYTDIALLGEATGHQKEAADLAEQMKTALNAITEKVPAENATVYFEVSPLEYGLWTAGNHTFMQELAEICGLQNAFSDVEGWGAISQEQVLERDPDYIVTMSQGTAPEEEILGRTGWESLKAVKNHKVLAIDPNICSRPGPRLVEAAETLVQFVYGEE